MAALTEQTYETTALGRTMLGISDIGQVLILFETARTIAEVAALFAATNDATDVSTDTRAQHERLSRTVGNVVTHCCASGYLRRL